MTSTSPYLEMTKRSELQALCEQYHAAQRRFMSHRYTGDESDLEARVAFDIEDKRLNSESVKAKLAYDAALAKASEAA